MEKALKNTFKHFIFKPNFRFYKCDIITNMKIYVGFCSTLGRGYLNF